MKRKKLLKVMNIGSKNYSCLTFIIKTVFYDSTYLAINKNTLSRPGKMRPNKVNITPLPAIE